MSYHIYRTRAFVLAHRDVGEAHRLITLLTREQGLVHATARGMREERSKLRYGLQDFSLAHVNLVRGREYWRVTGVMESSNLYWLLIHEPAKQHVLANIVRLLRRLLYGEERNEYLFDVLEACTRALIAAENTPNTVSSIERVTVLRILYSLGYIAEASVYEPLLKDTQMSDGVLARTTEHDKTIIREINRALRESHL